MERNGRVRVRGLEKSGEGIKLLCEVVAQGKGAEG